MNNVNEQFAELNQANVAQASKLSALALENAEKLAKINLETAKSALAQGVQNAQAVAAVKDVQQLYALNSTLAEASVQGALDYSKNLYQLATEAQAQYTALIEETWSAYTKGAEAWVEQASKSAPAGSEAAVQPVQAGVQAGHEPRRIQRARGGCQRGKGRRDRQARQVSRQAVQHSRDDTRGRPAATRSPEGMRVPHFPPRLCRPASPGSRVTLRGQSRRRRT
jgi:phasin family protein